MKYCEQCGNELEEKVIFCEECGHKVEVTEDTYEVETSVDEVINQNVEKTVKKSSTKKIILITSIVGSVIVIALLSYFVIYPKVMLYIQDRENQEIAQKVINLIDSAEEKEMTIELEENLDEISSEYDSLTKEQRKLVSNYGELEELYLQIEELKSKKVVEEWSAEVQAIDINLLTADDISVSELRVRYDSLQESEKSYVTEEVIKKLEELEVVVVTKKEERRIQEEQAQQEALKQQEAEQAQLAKINNAIQLINEFPGFSGIWGDFGVHRDIYQGMIEQAIKSSISLSDYFAGDVNEVWIEASGFQTGTYNPMPSGSCFITFEGLSPSGGMYRTLECAVNVDTNGNLQFVEGSYY